MITKVKVASSEFKQAESGGYVDGEVRKQEILFVYIELGEERPYRGNNKDDPSTRYRYFLGCQVRYATTPQKREKGDFELILRCQAVVIYC